MGEAYEYKPLLDNQIRLLEILPGEPDDRIECRLRTVSLNDLPAYAALSYVWGEDKTERPIWVEGKKICVWPNLEAALLEFRREPPTLEPISHAERVRNYMAAMKTISSDFSSPPPMMNDNWREMVDILRECSNLSSLFSQGHRPHGTMELHTPSAGGENWTVLNQKLSRFEYLAREFTYPRTSSWLVKQPRLLWIDAICINQQDTAERRSQIRIMGAIYLKAFLLVIWLGPEQDESAMLFKTLTAFMNEVQDTREDVLLSTFGEWIDAQGLSHDQRSSIRRGFRNLFANPWLTRGWIRQEYLFGSLDFQQTRQRILVTCGTSRGRDPIDIATILLREQYSNVRSPQLDLLPSLDSFSWIDLSRYLNACNLAGARSFVAKTTFRGPGPATEKAKGVILLKLVAESLFFQTSDPRDKIYCVLGLFQRRLSLAFSDPLPSGLIIDHSAPVQLVYATFMKWVVEATERLDIFIFSSMLFSEHVKVSWCPDWSVDHPNILQYGILGTNIVVGHQNYEENFPFDATPGSVCQASFAEDLKTMTVHGFVWDVVTRVPIICPGEYEIGYIVEGSSDKQALGVGFVEHLTASFREATSSEPSTLFYASLLESLTCISRGVQPDDSKVLNFKAWCCSKTPKHQPSPPQPPVQSNRPPQDQSNAQVFNPKFHDKDPSTTLLLTRDLNIVRPTYNLTLPGDLICVFPGCPIPMMLRPVEDHFELLGQVYVPGIMRGEAMVALQEKKVELREFVLH